MKAVVIMCVALVVGAACSSSNGTAKRDVPAAVTTTTKPRPAGPVADMSTELTGGKGVFIGDATPADVERVG